jgi:RimJ/RimL family protein N-acetyltransferase
MKIETSRLSLVLTEHPGAEMDPQAVLRIFNSNPDFIDDSEGRIGKFAYTLDEVRAWAMFQQPVRANQRYLAIRPLGSPELIGIGDVLTPHPRGNYAALGLLTMHRDWQGQGVGREAAEALETMLVSTGWRELELVVLQVRPRSRRFWEKCGYRYVGDSINESRQPCWVFRKTLG